MLNRIPLLWLVLILVTIASFALLELSSLPWITAIVMGLAAFKGYLIIEGFMELSGRRHILRYAMNLYCPVLALLIWTLVTP